MSTDELGGFRTYLEYKDSDVDWLGEIPSHWEVTRIGNSVTDCQNGLWGSEPVGDDDVVCVRVADFDRVKLRVDMSDPTFRSIDQRALDSRKLRKGDLLLEKSGGGEKQPVGTVMLYDHDTEAVCSNFIARMPISEGNDSVFLTYLHSMLYQGRINVRSIKQNTGIQNLNSKSYLNEMIGVPPLPEQQAIGRFLDHKTSEIDALIAAKEKLITLLQEKRAALITHAVTKGLDPSAPMKDSVIEWLGQIPAHWEVMRLGQIGNLSKGNGGNKQDEVEQGVPCIRYGDLYTTHDYFIHKSRSFVSPERSKDYTPIEYGDVLFAASGETMDEIGKSAINLMRSEACCGGDIILFRAQREVDPRYIGYATDCHFTIAQKATMGRGFTVVHIYGS